MTCEQQRWLLAQYVADGCPDAPAYHELRAHVGLCPSCQQHLDELQRVELALQAWPSHPVPEGLLPRILEALERERPPESWQPLPWNVWVPAATLLLALALALWLAPVQPQPLPPVPWLEPIAHWPALANVPLEGGVAAAFWIGAMMALVGIGVTLALAREERPDGERLDELRQRLADTAHRLWRLAGR